MKDRGKVREELIDELRELRRRISVLEASALEHRHAKRAFLVNMSHEVRTPLTAILGFSDVLTENVAEPESVAALKAIKRNGQYLLDLFDDLLAFSKLEAGTLEVEPMACRPLKVVAEIASVMRARAALKNLSLDVKYDGPIPEQIESDPTHLRRILMNLVGNAVKFTEAGSVRLVVRFLSDDGPEPLLQFDVIDTGIGMTREQMQKVFEPFVQGDASNTRKFSGIGLGLTIGKRLAEMLGGDIVVRSTPGKGSRFTLSIPTGALEGVEILRRAAEAVVERKQKAKAAAGTQTPLQAHILVVEDGIDNQRLISFLLKKAGATVAVAENGRVALDKVLSAWSDRDSTGGDGAEPFDLILMDMQMPVMDGYEATRALRRERYRGPIVALTAQALTHDRQKCLAAGCDDYMTKPIDRAKLLEMVRSHLRTTEPTGRVIRIHE